MRRTAEQITALYDQLTALPPPTGRAATYARTVAAKHGWVSPWAWDDDRIDDPEQGPQGVARSVRSHRARAGVR
jgi:hypothetical protein